jgi:hypothetical protein
MLVEYFESEFDIPDFLIEKFIKDFDGLPGSSNREAVIQLRQSTEDVLDYIAEEPEMLHETEYLGDFVKALAIRQALMYHGVLYDA